MDVADESSLIQAAQAGDREALDELLRSQLDRVYAVCRRMSSSEADAMDAAQEALITIARRIDRFDGRSKFSTWVYRVTTNACLDEIRRRKRRPDPNLPEHHDEPDPEPAFSERLADRDRLAEALADLPDTFKAPLVLRDVEGLDYAEIAEVLDLAPGTVRSRIARGRKRLAERLTTTSDEGHTFFREPASARTTSKSEP